MIYLVRHGQTDWNLEKKTQGHTDISLNDNGREQAKLVSDVIKDYKIDKIYSSDLLRAKETADIINEKFGLDIILDNRLREINYGDLEGIPRTLLSQDVWDVFNNNPLELHAEPMLDVYTRVKNFFDSLNYDEDILIVTHGGALRAIMYYISNREFFDKIEYDKNYRDMKIANGAIYKFDINDNSFDTIDIQFYMSVFY